MTKKELAELVLSPEELQKVDMSLPQNFVKDCENLLGRDYMEIVFSYVWSYIDGSIGGKPLNLVQRFFYRYQYAEELKKASEALLVDAMDRGECWDRDEEGEPMYDNYLALSNALDKIELAIHPEIREN